jgi:hypothetical protein
MSTIKAATITNIPIRKIYDGIEGSFIFMILDFRLQILDFIYFFFAQKSIASVRGTLSPRQLL